MPEATVSLVGGDGEGVAAALSDDLGRFAIDGVPAGRFELRVEALGYEPASGGMVELGSEPVLVRIVVEPAALEVGGLEVRVERRESHLRNRRQVISGRVLDDRSDDPVNGMSVVLRNVAAEPVDRTLTDEDGRFFFLVSDPGLYHLAAGGFGYDSTATAGVAVSPGQDLYLEVRVQPKAFGIDPIRVTAPRVLPFLEASGFYARMKRGHGSFLGPRDIERFPAAFPTQLLRRIPGVTVTPDGRVLMRGAASLSPGGCSPRLILDGLAIGGSEIDDILPLRFIDAIEVYEGASSVPARWRSHATCGVIAIWTKH